MDFLNIPKSPKTPDGPPPRSKSKSKSKSSSSHKQTQKSSKSSPKLLEPKSPDGSPPRSKSKSKSSSSHKQTQKSSKSSPKLLEPKSPDKSPPKPRSKSSTSSPGDYGNVRLKMPVPLSDKINYNAAIAKKMDKIFQSHDKLEPFIASFHLVNLFYLYLFKKYKTECHLPNQKKYSVKNKLSMHFFIDVSDHSKESYFNLLVGYQTKAVKETAKYVSECIMRGVKILIIPLTFQTSFGAHANLLIYRANTGVIEHFEPHGYEYGGRGKEYVVRTLNGYLEDFVKLINKDIKAGNKTLKEGEEKIPKITLIKADEVCPRLLGVQALEGASYIPKNALIEPAGYCEAWSMFFTELCLKNPEMSSREVYQAVMEKTELYENENDYLRNVIRGYTAFINNKIEKHFSRVFDEPITSAKAHSIFQENQARITTVENQKYMDKLLEIMEVERGDNIFGRVKPHTDVRDKYIEFTQGIRPETSSSSLKSADRISPIRKTPKVKKSAASATRKVSPTPQEKSYALIDRNKMSELLKTHREGVKLRKQQEKESKAIEKERIKAEKELAKTMKQKSATKAKTKTIVLEEP